MKKSLMIVLLAMLFVLVFTQVALADNHLITHETTGPVTITQGDSVGFQFYWYAGTPGLVRAFIRCSSVTVQIAQGDTIKFFAGPPDTNACWGSVQAAPPELLSTFQWANGHAKTPVFLAYWRMQLPTEGLPVGDYVFSWTLGFDHQTVDLGDWDGDGRIDHYMPGVVEFPGVTLHVEP